MPAGTESSEPSRPVRNEAGRVVFTVRRLPPNAFGFVMASGIVSLALHLNGWDLASVLLAGIAVGGLIVLALLYVWRFISFRNEFLRDAADPRRAFGYLTIVAGLNVVGVLLYSPHAPQVTIILAVISVPIWLVLNYGIPAALMLREHESPVAASVDGSWFLWVVATQSLADVAAVLGAGHDSRALAAIAVGLWGIGIFLYVMLSTLVTLRLLSARSEATTLSPNYWIFMGATAITVLAGSHIMVLSADLPVMVVVGQVVGGLTYLLWAFGLWWVPLLVIFGVWRHLVRRQPLRYESGLWSIVFPLGMYSAASLYYGDVAELSIVHSIGTVGTWVAAAAWLIVAALMGAAAFRRA